MTDETLRAGLVVSGRPRTPVHARAEENSGLVRLVLARHFPFLREDPDRQREAYAAGYIALLGACERFDAALGFTFSTYATPCIRGGILRSLRDERQQDRLPVVSLETPLGDNGSDLADVIADPQAEMPGAALASSAGFEALLAALPPSPAGRRQAKLLRALYREEMTLGEVAEAWDISRQRVHEMHRQAVQAIRKALLRKAMTRRDTARRAVFGEGQ